MITIINDAKTLIKLHAVVNANSVIQNVIQIKIGIMKHVNKSVKIIINARL